MCRRARERGGRTGEVRPQRTGEVSGALPLPRPGAASSCPHDVLRYAERSQQSLEAARALINMSSGGEILHTRPDLCLHPSTAHSLA